MGKSAFPGSLRMLRDKTSLQSPLFEERGTGLNSDSVFLTTAYLAPVEYFVILANAGKVFIEQHEHYIKQSYRSRCRIATANGVMDLSIPVDKSGKELIRDVRISKHSDWQKHHWRSIESAYNSSPFFEYYSDDLRPFFEKKWVFLWDFNLEIQQKILELLEIEADIAFSGKFETNPDESIVDLRYRIHPKKDPALKLKNYYQVFEQKFGFIANLSIIDLLFNMGNESRLVMMS